MRAPELQTTKSIVLRRYVWIVVLGSVGVVLAVFMGFRYGAEWFFPLFFASCIAFFSYHRSVQSHRGIEEINRVNFRRIDGAIAILAFACIASIPVALIIWNLRME